MGGNDGVEGSVGVVGGIDVEVGASLDIDGRGTVCGGTSPWCGLLRSNFNPSTSSNFPLASDSLQLFQNG